MTGYTHPDVDTSTPTVKEASLYWQWGGNMWQSPDRFARMIAKVKADALREAARAGNIDAASALYLHDRANQIEDATP